MKHLKNLSAAAAASLFALARLNGAPLLPVNDGSSNTLLLRERVGSYEAQGGSAATADYGEPPIAGAPARHTVWYRYRAPIRGSIVVDIKDDQGLRADLRKPGNPPGTLPIQTVVDGTSNTLAFDEERLSTDLERGEEVYLRVDAAEPFNFSWRFVEIANDYYQDATFLSQADGTVRQIDRGATLSPLERQLGLTTPGTWYVWTAPVTGGYSVDLVGSCRQYEALGVGDFSVSVWKSLDGIPTTWMGTASGDARTNQTRVNFPVVQGEVFYFLCSGPTNFADNRLWFSWYPQNNAGELCWAHGEFRVSEKGDGYSATILRLRGVGATSCTVATGASAQDPGASSGDDYVQVNTSVGFPVNSRSNTVLLPTLDDEKLEDPEYVDFNLSGATNGVAINTPKSVGTITSDEGTGGCGFGVREVRVREGETARIEVRRLTNGAYQIATGWRIEEDVGADLGSHSGSVQIDGDALSAYIEIPTYQDGDYEGEERFTVELGENPVSGQIVDGSSNTIVIVEDDDYFVPRAGRYCGLIDTQRWGALVNLKVNGVGATTGVIEYQGVRYPFRGIFGGNGELVCSLSRPGQPALGLRLRFGAGWDECAAALRDPDGAWADGALRYLPYDGRKAVAPQRGQYTVLCNGENDAPVPFVMTGTVLGDGSVRFVGKMADNTPVTCGGSLGLAEMNGGRGSPFAFSLPLYGKTGNFYGTLDLGLGPQQPGNGAPQWWHKPWRPKDAVHAALPFQTAESYAVRYTPPRRDETILPFLDGTDGVANLTFSGGGNIIDGTSNTVLFGERSSVSFPENVNQCSMKVNARTGLFSGRTAPSGGSPSRFLGVFVEGSYQQGFGFYTAEGRSGKVQVVADF